MSPASDAHALIQANLDHLLIGAIRAARLPLFVGTEGAIIPGMDAGTNVRVPDLVASEAPNEPGQQTVPDPVLIVEVLSPGNGDDTRDNVRAHATPPGLRGIAVPHSARMLAEVHRCGPDGMQATDPEAVGPGGRLRLPGAGLDRALEDAYAGTWIARGAGGS